MVLREFLLNSFVESFRFVSKQSKNFRAKYFTISFSVFSKKECQNCLFNSPLQKKNFFCLLKVQFFKYNFFGTNLLKLKISKLKNVAICWEFGQNIRKITYKFFFEGNIFLYSFLKTIPKSQNNEFINCIILYWDLFFKHNMYF